MKILKFTTILIGLIPLLFSCKATKNLQNDQLKKPKSVKFLKKKLIQNQFSAEWLSAKAKIVFRDNVGVQRFTGYIRWKKDSVIWMTFKKASITGAQVLIRPDSVFIIDRLNKEYARKDFNFVQKQYHLPVGFEGLQSMLLGNPVFFTQEFKSGINENRYYLEGKTDKYQNDFWLKATTFLLGKMLVEDYRNRRFVEMELGDYREFSDGRNFSYFRLLNLSSREIGDISVKIELSKLEIDEPKNVKFNIPKHYLEMQ